MTPLDWTAIAAGVAAIGWVGWYFFLAERGSAAAHDAGGVQEATVVVRGGYRFIPRRLRERSFRALASSRRV